MSRRATPPEPAEAEAAEGSIEPHEALILSERDREVFFDTLVNPPKPNARLLRAFTTERRLVGS
ncbi:MAG: DUF1778 domain-containing protein [Alphaproteobacteria bacterium]|nr:DUF1778 domain-containing protein [Alphaproteobacteria bacterium]